MDADAAQDWESPPATAEADKSDKGESSVDEGLEGAGGPGESVEDKVAVDDKETKAPVLDIEAEKKKIAEERAALNRQSYEIRKATKKLKEKETAEKPGEIELTDAQFEQLIETHDADPKMKVQIMKQMAKQIAKGTEVKATEAVEIKQLKSEQDHYLSSNWPDLGKEDSELRGNIDRAKSMLRVEDHPFSDFLSMASVMLMRLPEFVKAAEERGRASALKGKVEDKRKETIKGNKSSTGGEPPKEKEANESNNYGLSADQMETAKKAFGFKTPQQFKWYAANLKTARGQSGART